MKLYVVAAVLVTSVGASFAADIPPVPVKAVTKSADNIWTTTANLDVRYSSWVSNFGYPTFAPPLTGHGRGTQVYVPFGVQTTGAPVADWKFDFAARSGYVSARQSTPGLTGEVSTLTDTALSGTATYSGIAGFIPFLSLNVNAPTGKSALYGTARFARMDPDLVDIPTYGEGWNVGPTVGVNIPITASLLFTPSIGRTWRGTFDKEGVIDPVSLAQPTVRFNPGDVTTYSGALAYGAGKISANVALAYATETATAQDGVPQYRAGDRFTVSGGLGYLWDDHWKTNVGGYWTYSHRNDVFVGAVNALLLEAFNSNNSVYRINVDHTYNMGTWSVGPTASYLNRDRNGYSPVFFQFIPAKDRYGLGVVASNAVTQKASVNLRVEHIWTHENANPNPALVVGPIPNVNSEGWLLSGGGVVQF